MYISREKMVENCTRFKVLWVSRLDLISHRLCKLRHQLIFFLLSFKIDDDLTQCEILKKTTKLTSHWLLFSNLKNLKINLKSLPSKWNYFRGKIVSANLRTTFISKLLPMRKSGQRNGEKKPRRRWLPTSALIYPHLVQMPCVTWVSMGIRKPRTPTHIPRQK